jgi:hypothetical protein
MTNYIPTMGEKISDNIAQACSEESRSIEANMFKTQPAKHDGL